MKLKSILKTLSLERLQRIEEIWGIAPADLEGARTRRDKQDRLVANLYQRLQNRNAWETATRNLTDDDRNLIHFLAIHGGDLEEAEVLRRFFSNDQKAMEETLERLSEIGVVLRDEVPGLSENLALIGIPEPFLRFIDLPSFWEGYLGRFLKEKSNNELKHIATQGLRLSPESANKNYLIHLIRMTLLDPKFLRRYLERVHEGPAAVFQSLMNRNGVGVYRDLLELNVQRRYDHSRGDAVQWLLNTSGLVYTAVPGGNKYNNLLMVPRDIGYIVNNHFEPDERTFQELDSVTVVQKEESPSIILDNSNTLLRDVVVLCNYVDTHPIRVLATEGIGKNELKKVLPLLSRHKSVKYAEFLSLFLIERKFLVSTGDTYRVSQTLMEWLTDSRRAYQDILSWWLGTTSWNEEFVDGNTLHIDPKPLGLVGIVSFRRLVLEMLADMPRDRWCVERGFYEEVLPKVQQDIPRRNEPLNFGRHTRANDLVIESILAECLHWLGILAIGVKTDKDVETIGTRLGDGKTLKARGGSRGRPRKQRQIQYTFRFTDIGRFVFSRSIDEWDDLFHPHEPDEVMPLKFDVDAFIVQPTHEVIVPPDLKLRTFYHLTQFSEVRSIDVMSLMNVTTRSVREGLDHGLTADEILGYLRIHSRTGVPESLRILVEDCATKHGQVNMGYAGGYIVVDDEALRSQIASSRRFGSHVKKVFGCGVVILNPGTDIKRLSRELQKIGFMPRLESETVHMKDEETYAFTLPREDMVKLIAAVKFALDVRDDKGREVAHARLGPLLERLKTDPRAFTAISDLADPLVQTWRRASQGAVEAQIEDVRRDYSRQISHLLTGPVSRGTSKYSFDGPDPATELDDILRMLEFAIENEFEVEINYVKATRDAVREILAPESLDGKRLYAHCRTRDAYSVYRVDRIREAHLV